MFTSPQPAFPIWTSVACASYASPALDTTNLPPEQAAATSADPTALFCPSDEPRLQQRLVNTGGRLIKHARYYWLLLAESQLTLGYAAKDCGASVTNRIGEP
jgi:hypothetical protein